MQSDRAELLAEIERLQTALKEIIDLYGTGLEDDLLCNEIFFIAETALSKNLVASL